MTSLADVDGFKLFVQVCVWPRFPPLVQFQALHQLNRLRNCVSH